LNSKWARRSTGRSEAHRFPPSWTLEENNDACFIVRDANGQALGYFYFENEAGRRSAANLLRRDEARRTSPKARSFCRV
jgi:hypothetical protein